MKESIEKRSFVHYLAMWGCISTGLLYAAIGVIAILSFLKLKKGGADEGSFFVFLNDFFAGKIVIVLILLGMFSYIVWRIYETIKDPYGYGNDRRGIARRTVTALSSIADALIALSAVQALFNTASATETGVPTGKREMVSNIFEYSWGTTAIILIGAVTAITAVIQFVYVITRGYLERMNIGHLRKWKKYFLHFVGWSGHFARGIILGIIGFFLVKAAVTQDATYVVNTDKAFDFIGDHVGHFYFIVVAAGTVFYGIFMILFGAYYDSDADHAGTKRGQINR